MTEAKKPGPKPKDPAPIEEAVAEAVAPAPSGPTAALGRVVMYVTASETIRPAIITKLHEDGAVDLTVFNSTGAVPAERVFEDAPFEDVLFPHTYHWPTIA